MKFYLLDRVFFDRSILVYQSPFEVLNPEVLNPEDVKPIDLWDLFIYIKEKNVVIVEVCHVAFFKKNNTREHFTAKEFESHYKNQFKIVNLLRQEFPQ